MPNDKAESTIATAPSAGEQHADLSRQTFANPKEFLQVLQNDFGDNGQPKDSQQALQTDFGFDQGHQITRQELRDYEHGGDNRDGTPDVKGRAAAAMALAHYDDLAKMAKQLPLGGDDTDKPGLTTEGLALDMKIYDGSMTGVLLTREATNGLGLLLSLLSTAPVNEDAFSAIQNEMYKAPGEMRDDIKADQKEFGSWKEINNKAIS